jgi:thioredoxin 1
MAGEVTDKDFEEKTRNGMAIIDFYAEWCAPCKIMKPVFEKASKEFKNIKFYKLDVDAHQSVAEEFGVRSIPTMLFLRDGKEVDRLLGYVPEPAFYHKIKSTFT